MTQCSTGSVSRRGTPQASLAILGLKLRELDLFGPVRATVQIPQKMVQHRPCDKLYDVLIGLLAGINGVVEVNKAVRADPALQRAFGRTACAEQSVIQQTLDACTSTTVTEMEAALTTIYRQHSPAYRHEYAARLQLLDVDMSGLPCGPKAALATKGYFAKQRNRRGRQLGRVLATHYRDVVVDRVYAGTTQLTTALQPLVEAAEQTLDLDADRRRRTLIRIDAGGGSVDDVNWVLARGYQVLTREYSGRKARRLADTVTTWVVDPANPGREVGWVTEPASEYTQPLVRVAVRCRKANGQWGIGVVLSTLSSEAVLELAPDLPGPHDYATTCLLAYVYLYDQRGGGVETAIKQDKQGLGLTTRTKKRFEAQQMLTYLGTLAHNILVWSQAWLAEAVPPVRQLGIKRLVRDVWRMLGNVWLDGHQRVVHIQLNQADRWAHRLLPAFQTLLASQHVAITLDET